MKSLLRRMI